MQYFEIRLKGRLDESWADWFDDFVISYEGIDVMVLSGTVRDQPALFGLLLKIRDLGLVLISIRSKDNANSN
jgi:hypothetical protein